MSYQKSIFYRICFIVIFLCCCGMNMMAQKVADLTVNDDTLAQAKASHSHFILERNPITISFSYEDSIALVSSVDSIFFYVDDISNDKLKFTTTEIVNDSCLLTINQQKVSFDSLVVGTHQAKVVLFYTSLENEVKTVDLSTVANLVVISKPSFIGVEAPSSTYYKGEQKLTWEAGVAGGYDQGWSFVWTIGNDVVSREKSLKHTFNTPGEYIINLAVQNIIGDNDSILCDEKYSDTITIYQEPSASILRQPESDEYKNVVGSTDKLIWSVKTEGGTANWMYNWNIDGKETEGNAEYSQTLGYGKHTISVWLTNTGPNGETWLHQQLDFPSIYVYETAKADIDSQPSSSEYKDITDKTAELIWRVKASGGCDGKWAYHWFIDDKEDVNVTTPELKKALGIGSHTIKVVVTNTSEKGTSLYSNTLSFNEIYVYGKTSLEVIKSPDKFDYYKEANNLTWELKAQGGNDGAWEYVWKDNNVKVGETNVYKTSYPNVSTKETHTISYEVTNYNSKHNIIGGPYTGSYKITVYPEASVNVSTDAVEGSVYTKSADLSWNAEVSGGNDTGWTYSWKVNGEEKSTKKSYSDTFKPGKYEITFVAVNKSPDNKEEWFKSDSYSFTVNVINGVPTLVVDTKELEGYSDHEVTAKVHVTDSPENAKWSFTWTSWDGDHPTDDTSSFTFSLPTCESGSQKGILTVTAKVTVNGVPTDVIDSVQNISYISYPMGSATFEDVTALDVYSGSLVTLKVNPSGGKPSAWTYDWMDNGEVMSSNNSSTYSFNPITTTEEKHVYSVRARNTINGVSGFDNTFTYKTIILWPECHFPDEFVMTDLTTKNVSSTYGVREGNSFSLSIDDFYGGYGTKDNWGIDWVYGSNHYSIENPVLMASLPNSGKAMATNSVKCVVTLSNFGPDGKLWGSKEYSEDIVVYRKPQTPLKLVKKGSGASGTLIATTDLSDSELNVYKYYLVFGYDANGSSISKAPILQTTGTTRYDMFSANELANPNNRFWVYAQWNYSENVQITSGKCYLDGTIDDSFDGSVYVYTRSTIDDEQPTAISAVVDQSGVQIDSDHFEANLNTASEVTLTIFNTNGRAVRKFHFASSTVFNEIIHVDGLPKGMYLVEVTAGDMRKVKKIVVK